MLLDIVRFFSRLVNDQIEEFIWYVNYFTYSNVIKIFCYQMFLVSTFANLFFRCVYRNGDFGTDFIVNLYYDQRGVFYYRFFVSNRLRRVVDIVFVFQFLLQREVDVRGERVKYTDNGQQCFLYQSAILFVIGWCFRQFVYQFYNRRNCGVEGLTTVDIIGYFSDRFMYIATQRFLIFSQRINVQCRNIIFCCVFVNQFLDTFQEAVSFFYIGFLLFESYISRRSKYYKQTNGVRVVTFNYYLRVDIVVFRFGYFVYVGINQFMVCRIFRFYDTVFFVTFNDSINRGNLVTFVVFVNIVEGICQYYILIQ